MEPLFKSMHGYKKYTLDIKSLAMHFFDAARSRQSLALEDSLHWMLICIVSSLPKTISDRLDSQLRITKNSEIRYSQQDK